MARTVRARLSSRLTRLRSKIAKQDLVEKFIIKKIIPKGGGNASFYCACELLETSSATAYSANVMDVHLKRTTMMLLAVTLLGV